MQVDIRQIFISPGHNFFGHYGQAAGGHEIVEVGQVVCRAGWGLEGDRFYGYRPDYKGQVTFFDWAIYEAAKEKFRVPSLRPQAFRRNVLIEGVDINELIGKRFEVGGVAFEGACESRPCLWMNEAVAPGAEEWLRGNGGLRAKILRDGTLVAGAGELRVTGAAPTTGQAALAFAKPALE